MASLPILYAGPLLRRFSNARAGEAPGALRSFAYFGELAFYFVEAVRVTFGFDQDFSILSSPAILRLLLDLPFRFHTSMGWLGLIGAVKKVGSRLHFLFSFVGFVIRGCLLKFFGFQLGRCVSASRFRLQS